MTIIFTLPCCFYVFFIEVQSRGSDQPLARGTPVQQKFVDRIMYTFNHALDVSLTKASYPARPVSWLDQFGRLLPQVPRDDQ